MSKNSEIISLHVGQAGCQLGKACWEIYCLEHGIWPGESKSSKYESVPSAFFNLTKSGKVVPRAAFIDLEPTCIDEIRKGRFRNVFDPQLLISGKEDASNCFARGYNDLGREIEGVILQRIREMIEESHRFQGFLILRAYGGGTGSGLAASLIENLTDEYPKFNKTEFSIYPAPKLSSVIVEPYNAAFATHASLEHANTSFIVGNMACYDICEKLLDVSSPNFDNINRLMGQVVSSVTASLRFGDDVNVSLNEIQTNLIPYPRIQHPIIGYAPLFSRSMKQALYESVTSSSLVSSCFHPSNLLFKCDQKKGKHMSCSVLFRGDVNKAAACTCLSSLKVKKAVNFVEWCPTGFKVGVSRVQPVTVPGGDLVNVKQTCTVLANCTAVKTAWENINQKFDLMFAKRAFVHWYLMEGLEMSHFQDTRLDLGTLEVDYSEVENNF